MAARCILLSLLFAFVLVAASFTPTRADGDEASSFPCIPGRRRPRWLPPCSPPPPPPAECYTSLSGLAPCADFLTDRGVPAPAAACCDGLKSLVEDAPICICHVVNGDFDKLLPAPMLRLRMMELHRMCLVPFPRATLGQCIRGPVPPMDTPAPTPTPDASPPASPSTPPAASPPESPSTPPAASPPESPSTPPAASPPESPPTPPAASPPESPSTPPAASPPESPSTPPASPSTPPAASPPESPSTPTPPAASPPESPSTPPAASPPAESP